jgi:hypothetical protein
MLAYLDIKMILYAFVVALEAGQIKDTIVLLEEIKRKLYEC